MTVPFDHVIVGAAASVRDATPGRLFDYRVGHRRACLARWGGDHLAGARSAPFEAGEHGQIAVKVIDDRGNELLVVKALRK